MASGALKKLQVLSLGKRLGARGIKDVVSAWSHFVPLLESELGGTVPAVDAGEVRAWLASRQWCVQECAVGVGGTNIGVSNAAERAEQDRIIGIKA